MAEESKAFHSGIGYTIGNILIKGVNFLTLPIYSRILTTEEFGVYNVFVSYDSILFVIIGMALHSSVQSANYQFKGRIDKYVSSITLIYLINLGLMLGVVSLFRQQLASLLDISCSAVYLLIIGSFSSAVVMLYNTRISLDYSYKKYLLVSACSSVSNVVASLIMIFTVFREDRIMGRIIGTVVPLFVLALFLLLSFYRKAKPAISKVFWQFGVKYSLPIIPHGISQVLLSQCDRIMINGICGNAAAGIYSLAGNIKLVLSIVTDSIATAWNTWFFAKMSKGQTVEIQKRATQIMGLVLILSIGLMAISPEIILILGGEAYDMAKYVAIPMVMDGFILFLYNLVVTAEYYTQKTTYVMLGTMVVAVLNVVLNYIFISCYGYFAAAYTTLVSYVCYLLLHVVISRRLAHFYVVPIRNLLIACALVGLSAILDLFFVNQMLLRWALCLLVIIPIGLVLCREVLKKN